MENKLLEKTLFYLGKNAVDRDKLLIKIIDYDLLDVLIENGFKDIFELDKYVK